MGSAKGSELGLAGEFRVMSELLLRGHNPAKSYLENGVDLVLENGLRIEVKSAHKQKLKRTSGYHFSLRCGHEKKKLQDSFDFIICWCLDDECFYIVPRGIIGEATEIAFYNVSTQSRSKYKTFKDNWDLLK